MKYFFETYGCQMNLAESAALTLAARERGWKEADGDEDADVILINTCSVRATAEQRVFGRLAHYAALKKKRAAPENAGQRVSSAFTLVVAGCMAERLGDELKTRGADYVLGTSARAQFPLVLEAVEQNRRYEETAALNEKCGFSFSSFHHDSKSPFRSFVPIMHGCDNFCSYCIVPYVRGREVSRSPDAVLGEISLLAERGVREITLLGQNVNSYRWDGEDAGSRGQSASGVVDFPGLLRRVSRLVSGQVGADKNAAEIRSDVPVVRPDTIRWVRFLSSHPKDFSTETIRVLAENPCFCRHIHLCVQHGSNRILDTMNRRYTREQYLDLVKNLRAAMPDVSLSTDILVGFPGETEDDLDETLSLMEEVKFLYAYMYHYNPREGTAAYNLPGRISPEVKSRRLSRVIALQKRHTAEILKTRIGKEVTVLIEGISRKNADELICRTERDEMVVVPGSAGAIGSFARLTLSSLRGHTFRAPALNRSDL